MIAQARAADQRVTAPAGLGGGSPTDAPVGADVTSAAAVETTATNTDVVRPPGALPPGGIDHAARASVPDLAQLIDATLWTYVEGQPQTGPLDEAVRDQLAPDPTALAQLLQSVWDKSVELGTSLSDARMRGQTWSDLAAVTAGFAPLVALAPAVVAVATSAMDEFAAALPPVSEFPPELQAVLHGLEAFGGGLFEGLQTSGLTTVDIYAEIQAKFSTSVTENMIVATTVIQAGMVVGIVERVAGDLLGLVALIALFSSGPLLVAALLYGINYLWQTGATQIAHDLGAAMASAIAKPFLDLHAADAGISFLYLLGQIVGPLVLEIILFMIGEEALSLAARGVGTAARATAVFEKLRLTMPDTPGWRAVVDKVAAAVQDLLGFFDTLLVDLGEAAQAQLARLMQRRNATALLTELREYLEHVSADMPVVRAALARILDFVDPMTEPDFAGLLVLREHPPHSNIEAPGPPWAQFSWPDVIDNDEYVDTAPDLFRLLGAIDGRVVTDDNGLAHVIGDYLAGGGKFTGAAGVLAAAKSILTNIPDAVLRFEVDAMNRVLDIVAYVDGDGVYLLEAVDSAGRLMTRMVLKLAAEIKTYPGGVVPKRSRNKLVAQMRKDLIRHVQEGDVNLERLAWLLDPVGYAALRTQFEEMFFEALSQARQEIAKHTDYAAVEMALDTQLTAGALLASY